MTSTELSFVQSFSRICKLYQSLNEDALEHEPIMVFSKAYVFAFRKKLG